MKAVVAGLEMFGFLRPPGAAQCDLCGVRVQLRGRRYHRIDLPIVADLRKQGWYITLDQVGSDCICPDCL